MHIDYNLSKKTKKNNHKPSKQELGDFLQLIFLSIFISFVFGCLGNIEVIVSFYNSITINDVTKWLNYLFIMMDKILTFILL